MNKRHNSIFCFFSSRFFSLLHRALPFNSSSNNSPSPYYYYSSSSSSSFYSSVPLPMFLLHLRLPSQSLCFSFSSFPMTLLLTLILLSQFHMRLLLALHIRSLFIICLEYLLTFNLTVPFPIQNYFRTSFY